MNDLQTVLFEMTEKAERKFLTEARELEDHPDNYSYNEIDVYRHRWCALLDVIEEAGMFKRYDHWRNHRNED